MKKLRITKITVKTREIVSLSKHSAEKNGISHCPVCYAPITKMLPEAKNEKRTDELSSEIEYQVK